MGSIRWNRHSYAILLIPPCGCCLMDEISILMDSILWILKAVQTTRFDLNFRSSISEIQFRAIIRGGMFVNEKAESSRCRIRLSVSSIRSSDYRIRLFINKSDPKFRSSASPPTCRLSFQTSRLKIESLDAFDWVFNSTFHTIYW